MNSRTLQRVGPGLVVALVAVLLSTMALPASADGHTGTTTTTFTVATGGLAITVPATANLGAMTAGATGSAQLGQVTATDTRGLLLAGGYTVSVSSTDFTTGGATLAETLSAANVAYTGLTFAFTGIVTCLRIPVMALSAEPQTAMEATLATGTNSCSWDPTISVNLPVETVAGTYTGTITHSVA